MAPETSPSASCTPRAPRQEQNKRKESEQVLELVKSQIQRHEDDMAVHSSDLASLRAQITTMTSEVDLWTQKYEKLRVLNERVTNLNSSQNATLERHLEREKELEQVLSNQRKTIKSTAEEVHRILGLNAVLSSQLNHCKQLIAKSDDDVRSLTLEREVMTANLSISPAFLTDPHTDTKSFSCFHSNATLPATFLACLPPAGSK